MRDKWKKIRTFALVALVASLATAGVAQAVDDGSTETLPPVSAPDGRGTAVPTRDSLYVPMQPCRIASTAVAGGKFTSGQTRQFDMTGNLSAQGGSSSCGIPSRATALNMTITAVSSEGNGYVRVWPTSNSEPSATFMNFTRTFNVSNTGSIDVRSSSGSAFDLKVYGARTHIVIDVFGYHQDPIFATVQANGDLAGGSRVAGVQKDGVGFYFVNFDVNTDRCAKTVTVGRHIVGTDPEYNVGETAAFASSSQPGQVRVVIRNSAGTFIDSAFSVDITC